MKKNNVATKTSKTATKPTVRAARIANTAVIVIRKGSKHALRGYRAAALNTMQNGMTVAKYKVALAKLELKGYAGWALRTAIAHKLITLKG